MAVKFNIAKSNNIPASNTSDSKNKGAVRAYAASKLFRAPTMMLSAAGLYAFKKFNDYKPNDTVELNGAIDEALKQTGLYDKGVRVLQMEEKSLEGGISGVIKSLKNPPFTAKDKPVLDIIKNNVGKCGPVKRILNSQNKTIANVGKNFVDFSVNTLGGIFKFGLNACYMQGENKVIIPDKTFQTSVFHEMGHAMNFNDKGIFKKLSKSRALGKLAPLVLLVSLLNKRKTTDEISSNDSKVQKGADFIKRNAGKLTALALLPKLLEEGVASLRGGKVAKGLMEDGKLSKELLSKVKRINAYGFSTYLIGMFASVAAIKTAIHIKDKIQAKDELKTTQG